MLGSEYRWYRAVFFETELWIPEIFRGQRQREEKSAVEAEKVFVVR